MHKITFIIAILILITNSSMAKEIKYPAFTIPSQLKENADAVVREYSVSKTINSLNRVVTHEHYVVTILNKSAQKLGYFREYYDNETSISDYSIKKYNALGILTHKAKSSDFKNVPAYQDFMLYDDQRILYCNSTMNDYPYTIEIEFTKTQKSSLFLGKWLPIYGSSTSIEKASFEVASDDTISFRFMERNLPDSCRVIDNKAENHFKWEINNFEAIKHEPFMPNYYNYLPLVWLAPNRFSYDGYPGNLSSWNDYGKWIWGLIEHEDELPAEFQMELKEMVKSCASDKEKIEVLYAYLQNNTRYVNVSLGIGGFKPFSASTVHEYKYGDCKALSNYMRSMLKVVGIESNYTLIKSSDYYDVLPDFPNQQMNHIILCVPNKGDTVWLECTSQKIPFGYIGESNQNKHVLLVSSEGGKMVKTIHYNKALNTQFQNINSTLDSLGNITFNGTTKYKALQYDMIRKYFYLTHSEKKEALYKEIDIPGLKINSFEFTRDKNSIPTAERKINSTIQKYAKLNGDRLIFNPNILNQHTSIPKKLKKRHYPIDIDFEFEDSDTITTNLPNGYSIEFMPDTTTLRSEFGSYSTSFNIENNQLVYIRHFDMNAGYYDSSVYADFRKFLKKVSRFDQQKIVFLKEELN